VCNASKMFNVRNVSKMCNVSNVGNVRKMGNVSNVAQATIAEKILNYLKIDYRANLN